ncbi:imidazoleglycerol-phosphate dehydratase HisB [Candidatus Oleimmundimicrobium sp.]|uniref:imidazoleglycerol-phosphate dehydratase HisB n=1 Tax=Candidatus Oleimmundimicrobium sp. TaxID=3060597 RepID=UPI0027194642|nr:imidazoleglycerol-phosphate dehydratase HisB [Candidatus Oleimmundimicrobium sp.]MDO8886635.1 imidazoleglycerol-phosphate dehydratase HisB [Candidatus Oleimmundimicrobium sp.]
MVRNSTITRKTKETDIQIELNVDGQGKADISTDIPFFDHMLDLLARHGLFDLEIKAKGDLEVDAHHTVEDVGICLGQAFRASLEDKKGIRRFGYSLVPMDEALVMTSVDISGRPHLFFDVDIPAEYIGNFDTSLVIEFLHAFVNHFAITLHVKLLSGKNVHHCIEAVFKGLARAIDMATQIDSRIKGVPSTKGEI